MTSQKQLRKVLIVLSLFEKFLRTKCSYLNNYLVDYYKQVRNTERSLSIYSPCLIVNKNRQIFFGDQIQLVHAMPMQLWRSET